MRAQSAEKKRALLTPARPSNRAFERRNAILIQRIDLESTSRFGKPSTFAPRAKISLFSHQKCLCTQHTKERERKTSAKNTQKISNAKRPKTARTRRYSIYRTHLDVVERPFTEEFHFLRGEFSHICRCCYAFKMFLRVTLCGNGVCLGPCTSSFFSFFLL